MGYKVLRTESAERDLDEIISYLVEKLCNPPAAVELLSAIDATYTRLEETPFLYALCQHKLLSRRGYRKVFIRGYLLIYRVDEEQGVVYIERFFSDMEDFEQKGGNELVIGGKLTFLPGAIIEGGDDLFGQSEPASQIAYIADSEATTIAALKDDYNALLAAIRTAGLMVTGK